jgi:hypothetical protein
MGNDDTKYDKCIRWAKNHPIIGPLAFVGTAVIAIGAVFAAVILVSNAIRSCGSDEARITELK